MSVIAAVCVVLVGLALGAPFLVALLLVLYFCSLLPFAYLLYNWQWEKPEDSIDG